MAEWFPLFLKTHRRLHPHTGWDEYLGKPDDRVKTTDGWVRAFEKKRVTPTEALMATQDLQGTALGWPEHHLPALLAAVDAVRDRDRKEAEERAQAESIARAAAAKAEAARIQRRWEELPPEARDRYTEQARTIAGSLTELWPGSVRLAAMSLMEEST